MTRRERALAVVLGIVGVLFIMSQTKQGQQVVSKVADSVGASVRGIRNNNPGNIRKGQKWQGLRAEQTDPEYDQFVSMAYGCRALARVLATYRDAYGRNTVRKIISAYAPTNENDTESYINAVAAYMGVGADQVIDTRLSGRMFALMRGIIRHEVGIVASALVTDGDINEGMRLAA